MYKAYLLPNGVNTTTCAKETKSVIKTKTYMTAFCYPNLSYTWCVWNWMALDSMLLYSLSSINWFEDFVKRNIQTNNNSFMFPISMVSTHKRWLIRLRWFKKDWRLNV